MVFLKAQIFYGGLSRPGKFLDIAQVELIATVQISLNITLRKDKIMRKLSLISVPEPMPSQVLMAAEKPMYLTPFTIYASAKAIFILPIA